MRRSRYQQKKNGAKRLGFHECPDERGGVVLKTLRPTLFCAGCYRRWCGCNDDERLTPRGRIHDRT